MIDPTLRRDIQRLVTELAPPVPWLEERVMRAIPDTKPRASTSAHRLCALGLAFATAAALTIGVLLVGVLVSSHMTALPGPAPATNITPNQDPGAVRYRALVDADMRSIDNVFQQGCYTREACARQIESTKSAADRLLRDLSTTPPPSVLVPAADRLKATAQQFDSQLSASLDVITQPGSDYVAASLAPNVADINFAAASLDCWPAMPVSGDSPDAGFSCS